MTPGPAARSRPLYSVVIPVHNEREALPELHERLVPVLALLDGESEVILIDDGSTDTSWAVMLALRDVDRRYKLIRLSRNFGHQTAITAGMDLAEGDAVVIMDADLQDPPRWSSRWPPAGGRATRSSTGSAKTGPSTACSSGRRPPCFTGSLSRLTEVDIPENVGDFRLIDRRAVKAFRAMREGGRFVRGMYSWVGFRQIGVPYVREARCAGQTKYPMKKMVRLAIDAVTSFSQVPLRLALKVGAFFSVLALVGGLIIVALRLAGAYTVPGWTSILVAVCLLGGLQLAFLGVIGLYVGRTYDEALGRPLYIVSRLDGVATPIRPLRRAVIAPPATVESILGDRVPYRPDTPSRATALRSARPVEQS